MADNPFLSLPMANDSVNTFLGQMPKPKKGMLTENLNEIKKRDEYALSGLKQGAINDVGDLGNKFLLSIANGVGLDKYLPVNYNDYKNFSDADAKAFENSDAGKSLTGQATRYIGSSWPYFALPTGIEGMAGKTGYELAKATGKAMLKSGASMSGAGLVNDIADQNSFPTNTLLGGTMGLLTPLGLSAGKVGFDLAKKPFQWAYNYAFPDRQVLEKTANVIGGDIDNVLAAKQAGDRVGVQLTPAEASGNPLLAQMQGSAGTSEEGANKLYEFGKMRIDKQKNSVSDLFSSISPNPKFAGGDIRESAQNVIGKQEKELSKKAQPIYDQAYSYNIEPNKFNLLSQDPVINQSLASIQKNPIYQRELSTVAPNSLKVLDLVKRDIDDQVNMAMRSGEKNKARLLMGAKEKLVQELDKASPQYQVARSIYGEGAAPLREIKESNIGRLSDLSDQQLKNTSKIIFDPSQTDLKVMGMMRDQISKENPSAWNQIIRNEMERRLDKTSGTGSDFYTKILKGNRDFNQFSEAVKNIPGAQQKLADMKLGFKNLINPVSPKTAATLAKSSLDVPRSTSQMVKNVVDNILGGRYDNAMVDFITNPNWDKKLLNFMKESPKKTNIFDKATKFTSTLEKILAAHMNINNSDSTGTLSPPTQNQMPSNPFLQLPSINK